MMWKRKTQTCLPGSPETSCGEFVGKRLESSCSITATVWEHERNLTLLLSAEYERSKGVVVGTLHIAGDESVRRKQIADLIDLLTNLMEEN